MEEVLADAGLVTGQKKVDIFDLFFEGGRISRVEHKCTYICRPSTGGDSVPWKCDSRTDLTHTQMQAMVEKIPGQKLPVC